MDPITDGTRLQSLSLRDGRRLAFREYGDPAGAPVLACHSWGVSGLVFSWYAEQLRALGRRLVVPDRPGLGGSDPTTTPGYLGAAADVAELADHLGLETFPVLGVSGGGPYALATAALLPDRVTRLVVVAGNAPARVPEVREALGRDWRLLYALSRRAPWLAELYLRRGYAHAVERPGDFLDGLGRIFAPADVQVLDDLRRRHGDVFVAAPFVAAVTHGRATADRDVPGAVGPDATALVREQAVEGGDWGFEPAQVHVPTSIWHGTADATVPIEHSRYLADTVPGAWLTVVADEGHLLLGNHLPELLADLE